MGAEYLALAVLVPTDGEEMGVDAVEEADRLDESGADERGRRTLERAAKEAEEAAQEANDAKDARFPARLRRRPVVLHVRAGPDAFLHPGADNPLYRSVDAWSFSVPLDRAQAYYASPAGRRGARRHRRWRSGPARRCASGSTGYAAERSGPGLRARDRPTRSTPASRSCRRTRTRCAGPRCTPRRSTRSRSTGPGTRSCTPGPDAPKRAVRAGAASIAQMEAGGIRPMRPACGFTAASMGKVAAASTSIENGFEYHYEAVAQAAEEYQRARAKLGPLTAEVKGRAGGLLDSVGHVLGQCGRATHRRRPAGQARRGGLGGEHGRGRRLHRVCERLRARGRLVGRAGRRVGRNAPGRAVGRRAATVVSSLLDGLRKKGGAAVGALGVVLDCWSGLLGAYLEGQEALEEAVGNAVDALPFASASGLGRGRQAPSRRRWRRWASNRQSSTRSNRSS